MTFHEFGKGNDKVIVMLHGACMSWKNFKENIRLLKKDYHVIAVAAPGHDLYMFDEFTTIENIAKRTLDWLLEQGIEEVDLLYGFSMGGGVALRMLAYERVHFKHVILDGGITPKFYPKLVADAKLWINCRFKDLEKRHKKLINLVYPPDEFDEAQVKLMNGVISCMSDESIRSLYKSMDEFRLPEHFPKLDTSIEYWYGQGEIRYRRADIAYIKRYIDGVRFRQIPGMDHGEYVMGYPKQFARQIRGII